MRRKMIDNRRSLWDVNIQKVHIGNKTYALEGAPDRGGSCFVYHARKMVTVGEETYEHKVLLKEFYPILDADKTAGIKREDDGTVYVPEATKVSEDYTYALRKFREAYGLMLELGKTEIGAEATSIPLDFMEDCGTYYIEEAFDSGRTFEELFGNAAGGFIGRESFFAEEFFPIYLKCIETVSNLHKLGYLHLDFNPKNISYTYAGNVKLFDTDTFVKKEELDKVSIWRGTKGFSAPEVRGAARFPEDAPELIGEWTDVYSLTQLFCWFLWGHALEEHEIEDTLEDLESQMRIMDEAYHFLPNRLSRSGLYRLKRFLSKNLSRKGRNRTQTTKEMLLEAKELQKVLFYKDGEDVGVPVDNFCESKQILFGHKAKLTQLNECLAARATERWDPTNVAVLIGADKAEREALARYYGTINRLKYSDIVEIHCDGFGTLRDEIVNNGPPMNHIGEFRSRGNLPILFIIFDEQEKNFIRTNEIRVLNELMEINRCQVLITGKHNRFIGRMDEFSRFMKCTTIELEGCESESLQAGKLSAGPNYGSDFKQGEENREKATSVSQSWKNLVLWGISGLILMAIGVFFVAKANDMVGPMIYTDTGIQTEVYSFKVLFNEGVWLHILGVILIVLGVGIDVHSVFDFRTPYGWKYFIRQFRLPIVGFTAAVFSWTLPDYFGYSSRVLSVWDNRLVTSQFIFRYVVGMVGIILFVMWMYQAMAYHKKRKFWTDVIGSVLLVVSVASAVTQTIAAWSECILMCVCLAAIYVGIGAIRE